MVTITEHIDPESESIKDVFAHFGLAMYRAQCLERQMAIMLATQHLLGPATITKTEFEKHLDGLFSKTLGNLVNELKIATDFGEEEGERLDDALSKRNWLAHRYFGERATEFLSESGRASMLRELQNAADYFDTLDNFLTCRTKRWGEAIGITQQLLDEAFERLVNDRKDQLGNTRPELTDAS